MDSKLKRTFVREEAYELLRDWIVEGKLEAGRQLRDKELAVQLGVSRTPIREALLRLEDEGLVQTKPNRSTRVCPLDLQKATDLYSLVATLEGLALKQAVHQITHEALERMTFANERLRRALEEGNPLEAVNADTDFHSVLVELAQNEELSQILFSLKQKLKRLELYYFERVKSKDISYHEHQKLIGALKEKDLRAAQEALELNWNASLTRIQLN